MSFLDQILTSTRARVDALRAEGVPLGEAAPPKPFAEALRRESPSLVAELKRATPSAGILAQELDAERTARAYRRGGAAAISVLTEPDFFRGSHEDLTLAASAGLPLLCKDFIVDPLQIQQARSSGADAVLLIVRVVEESLAPLLAEVSAQGMEALVEVFDETDVEAAIAVGASLIGINHRDLVSFEVDPDRTSKLAPLLPEDVTLVSLSGVETRSGVEALHAAGAHSVLVGTSLVTAPDPEAKLRELRG